MSCKGWLLSNWSCNTPSFHAWLQWFWKSHSQQYELLNPQHCGMVEIMTWVYIGHLTLRGYGETEVLLYSSIVKDQKASSSNIQAKYICISDDDLNQSPIHPAFISKVIKHARFYSTIQLSPWRRTHPKGLWKYTTFAPWAHWNQRDANQFPFLQWYL